MLVELLFFGIIGTLVIAMYFVIRDYERRISVLKSVIKAYEYTEVEG